jgi:hypothetical protein
LYFRKLFSFLSFNMFELSRRIIRGLCWGYCMYSLPRGLLLRGLVAVGPHGTMRRGDLLGFLGRHGLQIVSRGDLLFNSTFDYLLELRSRLLPSKQRVDEL